MNKYKIQQIPIWRVKLNEKNPRFIKDGEFKKLVKSLEDCPQLFEARPLLCSDRTGELIILGGNMRYRAALELKLTHVPVIVMPGLTEAQEKEIIIKDNGAFGEWDIQTLAADWAELPLAEWGVDLPVNFMEREATDDDFDADAAIDNIVEPITKTGDVWLLGRHRIMCGDSTKKEDVGRLMGGKKAVLLQTDPPYGIAYVKNAQSKGQSKNHVDIENDDLDGEKLQIFLEETIKAVVPHITKNCAFYLWHPMLTQGTFFAAAAAAADILIHRQIIWCKPSLVFGRGDYHWQHELCFYGWIKGNHPPFYGERNQTTLWRIGRETSKDHPTAKPVELWTAPILNHTKENEIMYEPFCGSGSQIIAAEQLNRICYGMEIEPVYVDVIIKRWEKLTGGKAILQRS